MSIRQDVLLAPAEQLETALAARAPGRERDWAGQVDAILGGVVEALRRHVADTDAAGGMFTTVDLTRPTLVRQVSTLRREHTALLERAGALRQEVRNAATAFDPLAPAGGAGRLPAPAARGAVPDFGSLRWRLGQFAAALKHHRDEEAGLLLESVTTDIGVGD
jgi:hypothetical protein